MNTRAKTMLKHVLITKLVWQYGHLWIFGIVRCLPYYKYACFTSCMPLIIDRTLIANQLLAIRNHFLVYWRYLTFMG